MLNIFKKAQLNQFESDKQAIENHGLLSYHLQVIYDTMKKVNYTDDQFLHFIRSLVSFNGDLELSSKDNGFISIEIKDKQCKTRYL